MSNFRRIIERSTKNHSKRRRHYALQRRSYTGDPVAIAYMKAFHTAQAKAKAKA